MYLSEFLASAQRLALVILARGSASLGGIIFGIIISRYAGASTLGSITFAITATSLLSIIGRFGLDTCLTKEASKNLALNNAINFQPIFYYISSRALLFGVIISFIIVFIKITLPKFWISTIGNTEPIFFATLPLIIFAISAGYVKGIRYVALSGAMDIGVISLITSVVFLIIFNVNNSIEIEIYLSWIFLIVCMLLSVISIYLCRYHIIQKNYNIEQSAVEVDVIYKGSFDFTVIAVASFVTQAGSFVVAGFVLDSFDLGLARPAERLSLFVSFPLVAINLFISPRIVHLKTLNQNTALKNLIIKSCFISGSLGLPFAIVLVFFPLDSLQLFGSGFDKAYSALILFAITQLISATFGPFGAYLFFSGKERIMSKIMLISLILSLLFFPLGAYFFGPTGFAASYLVVNSIRVFALVQIGWQNLCKKPF